MNQFFKTLIFFILWMTQIKCYAINESSPLINISFQGASVTTVLEFLAKFSDKNMVVNPNVTGNITFSLRALSFEQILAVILHSQGLIKQEDHGVIYVSTGNDAANHQEINEPIESIAIDLHNAKAIDVAKLIQSKPNAFLSNQGTIEVDERTNNLLIQDTKIHLSAIQKLIKQLDVPVSQILIAARVVNIDSDYENQLGVRFGVTDNHHHLSGSLLAANQLVHQETETDPLNRLNVDLPAVGKGVGQFGLALFKIAPGTLVDLELSALESEGHAKIISSPELIAANQQSAMIQSGQEIPYQEKTASGATSITFKKAVLSLKVTPQIIHGSKILLHLQVNQDSRSSKEVLGVPTIDTREISTEVIVNDKQTIALGGIYEETETNNIQRVPFFASLPVIGALFRYRKVERDKRELMIFVTPTIILDSVA